MKKLLWVFVFALLTAVSAHAEPVLYPMQGDVRVFEENGLAGLMNEKGEIILPAEYSYIKAFNGKDFAVAGVEYDKGIVSRDGRVVLEPEWMSVELSPNGNMAVYYDEYRKQYLMDLTTGEVMLEGNENTTIYFSGDYVCVMEYDHADFIYYPPYTTEVYDRHMNLMSVMDAWVIRDFAPCSRAEFSNGLYGLVTPDGTVLISGLETLGDFYNGYASYVRKETDGVNTVTICGLVDMQGKVIEARGEKMLPGGEGLYIVRDGDLYGYVDKDGKTVIPAAYQQAYAFVDGSAVVKQDGEYFLIDTSGKPVCDMKWGWNSTGYSTAVFEMPLVPVGVQSGYLLADRKGYLVGETVYREISEVFYSADDTPYFIAEENDDTYYLIGMDGKPKTENAAASWTWFSADPGYIWIDMGEGFGRFDPAVESFVSRERFSDVELTDGIAALMDGETWVEIDENGNITGPSWVDPEAEDCW